MCGNPYRPLRSSTTVQPAAEGPGAGKGSRSRRLGAAEPELTLRLRARLDSFGRQTGRRGSTAPADRRCPPRLYDVRRLSHLPKGAGRQQRQSECSHRGPLPLSPSSRMYGRGDTGEQPPASGEPSTWLTMVRLWSCWCSIRKTQPFGRTLIERPVRFVIRRSPRSWSRGVVTMRRASRGIFDFRLSGVLLPDQGYRTITAALPEAPVARQPGCATCAQAIHVQPGGPDREDEHTAERAASIS